MPARRTLLQMFAGAALLAATSARAFAKASVIARLIDQASQGDLSQRIEFISHGLLGARYQADTLIGGPRKQEVLVMRDDAFDCVTFCETVLAAAMAKNLSEFEPVLRHIRYEHGEVRWNERNHYFAEWSRRIVEKHMCRPVAMEPSVSIEKTVDGVLGPRKVAITGIAPSTLIAGRDLLHNGDVIGFVSKQSSLDFFHVGFITFGKKGSLLLRHASQNHGRVLDEDLKEFLADNGVKYVTLLRAQDTAMASN